jgi:hypothetical protein
MSSDVLPPNRRLLRDFVLLGAGFFVVAAILYAGLVSFAPFPRDGSGLVVGRDFLNLWMYGRATASAHPWAWYNLSAYQHALATLVGPGYPGQNWSYPPNIMLLAAPFGRMAYLPALALWTGAGLFVFLVAARWQAWSSRVLLATLASPAAFFCLISGQSAFFIAAILSAIFCLLGRKPVLAGLLIATLTFKPQIGLLFPLALAASGRWRAFAAAVLGTIAIAAATTMLFGAESWIAFVREGIPTQNLVLVDRAGIAGPFYSSIFMNLHSAGLSYGFAMTVQVIFAFLAAAILFWVFRWHRDANPYFLLALFTACTATALPYLLIYDTLPMALGALLLLESGLLDAAGRLLVRFVYWLPLLQIGLGKLHLPGSALVAPVFMAVLLCTVLRRSGQAGLGEIPGFSIGFRHPSTSEG